MGGRGRGATETPETEGSNSGPRGVIRQELDRDTPERTGLSDDMSGRGREVLNLRRRRPAGRGAGGPAGASGAGPSGVTPASPEERPEKRTRHEEAEGTQARDKDPIVIEEEDGDDQGGSADGAGTDTEVRASARETPWAPEVRHYTGRLIHHADSAVSNIGTAFGLMRSCVLPRDAKSISGRTEDLTGEIAQALIMVTFLNTRLLSLGEPVLTLLLFLLSGRRSSSGDQREEPSS